MAEHLTAKGENPKGDKRKVIVLAVVIVTSVIAAGAWYWLDPHLSKETQEQKITAKEPIKPDNAEGYYNLGLAHAKLDRHKEAIKAYKEAVRIKPGYADAYYNMGVVYSALSRWQEAVDAYKEAIRIKPDYARVYYNLGVAYGNLGRHPEAIKTFNEAVRLMPDDAVAHYNLGVAYMNSGNKVSALKEHRILKTLDKALAGELLILISSHYFK